MTPEQAECHKRLESQLSSIQTFLLQPFLPQSLQLGAQFEPRIWQLAAFPQQA